MLILKFKKRIHHKEKSFQPGSNKVQVNGLKLAHNAMNGKIKSNFNFLKNSAAIELPVKFLGM